MIIYQEKQETSEYPSHIICDKCKTKYEYDMDDFEIQEFTCLDFIGGYSSVFGDGVNVKVDICQHCLKEMIEGFYNVKLGFCSYENNE